MRELDDDECSPLELSRAVIGIRFPATTSELIEQVRAKGAQPEVVHMLRGFGEVSFASREQLVDHARTLKR